MPIDQSKLDQFKQSAMEQGYDERAVTQFVNSKMAASKTQDKEIAKYSASVGTGMPLSYVPEEYRADVYTGAMEKYKVPGYDPESDDVLQRGLYKDQIAFDEKDLKDKQDAQREVNLYRQKAIKFEDMSNIAKEMAIGSGMEVETALGKEEKKGIGSANTLKELMNLYYGGEGSEDNLSYGRWKGTGKKITSLLGVEGTDREKVYEDLRSAFAGSFKDAVGETGRLTDQDVRRIKGAIPSVFSKPEEAEMKWNMFFDLMESQYGIDVAEHLSLESGDSAETIDIISGMRGAETGEVQPGVSTAEMGDEFPELGITDVDEVKKRTGFGETIANIFVGRHWDNIKTILDTPKLKQATEQANKMTEEYNKSAREYLERAKIEKDPAKKKDYLARSRELSKKADTVGGVLDKSINNYMENTGIEAGDTEMSNLEFAGKRAVGVMGETAAYLLPGTSQFKALQATSKLAQVGLGAAKYGTTGAIYAGTDENLKTSQDRIDATIKGAKTGAVIGAVTSGPGMEFIGKATDKIPGVKWVKSSVKMLSNAGKKWVLGDKSGAVNELLGLSKNKSLVGKLQQKGINLADDAQPYISRIGAETHDEMLTNTNNLLKPSGEKLNASLRESGEMIKLSDLQDEILQYADDLANGGTASDKRKADAILTEAESMFGDLGDEITALVANEKKSLYDSILWSKAGTQRNITPTSAADAQVKDMFSDYVRKLLKKDPAIASSLREYEILKAIQTSLKHIVRGVEGTTVPTEALPTSIGSLVKKVSSPSHTPEVLTKKATDSELLRKTLTPAKNLLDKVPGDVKRSGATVGLLGEGGGGISVGDWQEYSSGKKFYK